MRKMKGREVTPSEPKVMTMRDARGSGGDERRAQEQRKVDEAVRGGERKAVEEYGKFEEY